MAILRSLRSTMVPLIGITLMALPVVSASNSTNATGGIVPLSPQVGTGLLPTHLEGGLVESVGNRFTNALYAPLSNITDGNVGWSSCWGCVLTIAEELPCVFAAIAAENPALLLDCGVTFSNICDCLSCLPDAVQPFVQTFCGNNAYKPTTPTRALANATYSDSTDYNVHAFLGKMDAAEVAYVQKQNAASCVIGKECGGVCCIGGCVDYLCVGQPTFCDVQPYGQCGGQGWAGCTACVNSTCEAQGAFYSQCLPLA